MLQEHPLETLLQAVRYDTSDMTCMRLCVRLQSSAPASQAHAQTKTGRYLNTVSCARLAA